MTKYRIDASFDLIGGFWSSESPDEKWTGTLSCKNGSGKLVSSPTYTRLDDAACRQAIRNMTGDQSLQPIGTILGFTTDKKCSLLGCYRLRDAGLTNFPSSEQLAAKQFMVSRTVMGLHVDSPDAESIDGAAFYFTKLHNWLPSPWHSKMEVERTTYVLPTSAKEAFSFCSLELNAEVVCEVFAGGSDKVKKGTSIKPVPRLKITPKTPQSVEWYNSLAFRIENFFTLFMGTSVAIKRVQFFQGDDAGWLVQKMRHKQEKVNAQTWVRCPQHRVSAALAKWLSVPKNEQPVELMLLGSLRKSSVFVETEFLCLAQALEGFGRLRFRKTASSRTTFASFIEQTYDLLSPDFALNIAGEKATFVRNVVDTRNYYTHLGNSKGKAVLDVLKDLFLFNQRLHAFVRCVMLIELGVPESELKDAILYQATKWR